MIKKIPSLIDTHIHLREPGFTNKETIETGLKAAIKGGFGAVLAMPNTNPVNDDVEVTKFILKKALPFKNEIDLYPVSAITYGLNENAELVNFSEMKKAGCIAFSNDGLPVQNKEKFKAALMKGELILSHLEDETNEAISQIETFREVLNLSKKGECPIPKLHFCHISKKSTIEVIKKAKDEGLKITAETAPHYFTLTNKDIDKTGRFKMNPPLGDIEDRKAVIEAVKNGVIDIIATDHAPHTKEEKLKPYNEAPNGIVGLETAFSLSYMQFGLDLTLEKMVYAPSKLLGIKPKKEIQVDLGAIYIVRGKNFESKCKITPYEGKILKGKILWTLIPT